MITACTVILDDCSDYLPIYLESISTRTKFIDEVLMPKTDSPPSLDEKWEVNGIKFHKFGILKTEDRLKQGIEHGLGLHECIHKAKNDLLLFHDPDVFYYKEVDGFFYDLMIENKLDIVGISHCAATKFGYTFFPYLSNLLLDKKKLPDEKWLEDQMIDNDGETRNGKYLVRSTIPKELKNLFPNPTGDFDTGSNLWLWAYQNDWKWLSFQTTDIHNYTTKFYRGNPKLKLKLKNEKLLYHATSCTAGQEENLAEFERAWQESKEDL